METKLYQKIYRQVISGKSFAEIAQENGWNWNKIRIIINKLHKLKPGIRSFAPFMFIKQKRNIEIYCKILTGKKIKELSDEYNLNKSYTRTIFTILGGKKNQITEKTAVKYKEIYQKIESGQTFAETAREYSLSRERIRQIFNGQGGSSHLIRAIGKERTEKRREQKYQTVLEIVREHAIVMGYIPRFCELKKFLLKNGGVTHLLRISKELVKTMNLPHQSDIIRKLQHEKMLQELKHIYDIVQRQLNRADMKKYGTLRYESYRYAFGTFKQACLLAGIPFPKRGAWYKKGILKTG
ncbi:MAG: hypothetical protein V1904_07840 [Bacteroidota bacterium]